jgi:hypothetical protein
MLDIDRFEQQSMYGVPEPVIAGAIWLADEPSGTDLSGAYRRSHIVEPLLEDVIARDIPPWAIVRVAYSGTELAADIVLTLDDIALGVTSETDQIIKRIEEVVSDPSLRDEDEPPPPAGVADEAIALIRDAAEKLARPMLAARVSTYYGELNITWRSGDEIVRLACFPGGRPSVIQFGSLASPFGSYKLVPNATADILADRLADLPTEHM